MMSYRDTTFCEGGSPRCAQFGQCFRALTPEVRERAAKWWGGPDAPITRWAVPEQLDCYVPPQAEDKKEAAT